jgi:3-methylcrotonyl-CoA carboxylase alpha subunit
VRVDTGVAAGQAVTPFYDAMIAKLIAHAPTRTEALDRLTTALGQTLVAGPRTNAAFLERLLRAEQFRAGQFDTGFIEQNLDALGAVPQLPDNAAAARGVAELLAREAERLAGAGDGESPPSPWDASDGFQLTGTRTLELSILVDDQPTLAQVTYRAHGPVVSVGGESPANDAHVVGNGRGLHVIRRGRQTIVALPDTGARAADAAAGGGVLRAPMHGKVIAVFVDKGANVRKGQRLAIIEAMKMEHALVAPFDGRVAEVAASAGSQIAEKAPVLIIEPVE